jgi:hypothetical protein
VHYDSAFEISTITKNIQISTKKDHKKCSNFNKMFKFLNCLLLKMFAVSKNTIVENK